MIKEAVKHLLGEKNTQRIKRLRDTLTAARVAWRNSAGTLQTQQEQTARSCLLQVHSIEKAIAIGNTKYIENMKYSRLIASLDELIRFGMSPENFTVKECIAVIRAALGQVPGHDDDKKALEDFIMSNDVSLDFRGGAERVPKTELLRHNDFDFGAFVRSRRSVRRFKDKIISREVIHDIIEDAKYYPSACNRQPCKVYFSENPDTLREIINCGINKNLVSGVHDALIVTCDRALLSPAELNDQEYINGGIFLAYLLMSIHAHGLGSCLCQFLQVNSRQDKIRASFGIPKSEVISAFVAIGELEDEVNCACAQRRPTEEIMVNIDGVRV